MSIIGKFLKIAGKDPNGNAKGVAVTENGEVKVQQTGSIVSDNVNALSGSNLNPGQAETILVQPKQNIYKRLLLFGVKITWSGASSGNVEIKMYKGDTTSPSRQLLQLSSSYTNNTLEIRPYYFNKANIDFPRYFSSSNEWSRDFLDYIKQVITYSYDNPLTVEIRNNLDVSFTVHHFNLFEEVIG